MVEALVFDIDGTLYDYEEINSKALKKAYEVMREAINLSYEQFLELRNDIKNIMTHQISGGMRHDKYLQFQLMLDELGLFDGRLVMDMGNAYWKEFFRQMKRDKELVSLFRRLSKSFGIGIASNLYLEVQLKKLQKLGVIDYIDAIVTSEEVEREKPSAVMFLAISNKLNLLPRQCAYFGDDEYDMLGASFVGMRAVSVGKRLRNAEFHINNIYEVEKVIEKL